MTNGASSAQFGHAGEARTAAKIYHAPAGTRVYAIGDIHGRADLLARIHKRIRADARKTPDLRKVVVYLGDYIDRGAKSRQVIDMLLQKPLEGFEAVHLKGNHEDYMLSFIEGSGDGLGWLFNGGETTIASYGVAPIGNNHLEAGALDALRTSLETAVPSAHRTFLSNLKLHHREGGYLFVHAGIRPEVALAEQSEDDLMWIRDEFLGSEADHDCRVVHGHTISWSPEILPNRIGIDTGAFISGELTCLVIEGAETRFLTARR